MERGARNGNNKRNSGIFDEQQKRQQQQQQQQLDAGSKGIQRRPSKNARSADRRGQVFVDDFPANDTDTARASTPDVPIDNGNLAMSPGHDSGVAASPASTVRSYRELPPDRSTRIGFAQSATGPDRSAAEHGNRPRGVTLEGPTARSRSPITKLQHRANRNRVGSLNAADALQSQDNSGDGGSASSIGFPSIISTGLGSARSGGARSVKSPPRPLSPATTHGVPTFPVDFGDSLPSPTTDTSRILSLMRTTCGRMHGILSFRTARTGPWNSGYCAINVASGSLIYQESKGNITQTKTLVPDLRGCLVRTQGTRISESGYLEIYNHASGVLVHLRPKVLETFDSWLAALLCWQPLIPKKGTPNSAGGNAPRRNPRGSGGVPEPRPSNPRRNSSISVKDAAAIKFGKMLFWDHEARVVVPQSPRRIFTYKQQRSASGTPWSKVSATLQANGQLKLNSEQRDNTLLCVVPLSLLARSAIQRLHPSVLDDEYCIGIYPRYTSSNRSPPLDMRKPIYLSLETRVLFESWYALLKAFTIPELYGPESSSIQSPAQAVEAGADAPAAVNTDSMFRLERVLSMRITEAKLHSQTIPSSTNLYRSRTNFLQADFPIADYHAEVLLDDEIRGRTAVKSQTANPFWREDYVFTDLPPVMGKATVKIQSRNTGQRDWTLVTDSRYNQGSADIHNLINMDIVGEVQISPLDTTVGELELQLQDLERCRDIERWWQLLNDRGEVVGDVLLKVRLDEAVVLMSQEYKPLTDLLHQFSGGLTQKIVSTFPAAEVRELPEILLNIFQVSGKATDWLISLVEDEIDGINYKEVSTMSRFRYSRRIASNDQYDSGVEREMFVRDMRTNAEAEANLLFRGNSLLTRALDTHMKRVGKEYLDEVLGEHMRDIGESDPDCEVDPLKVSDHQDVLDRNWRNLIVLTENIWNSIAQSVAQCPPELRLIFRHIRSCAEDRYGDFRRSVSYSSVSGFLFLRFLVPAVLNPKLFGLLKDHPRPRANRTLTLIAKSLQTLANMSTFGTKEPWMEPMNAFLSAKRQEFKDFVDAICNIAADHATYTIPPSYLTPMQIKQRLPETSREGFPSLPLLLDAAYECANLVSLWIDATSEVQSNGDTQTTSSTTAPSSTTTAVVSSTASQRDKSPEHEEQHLIEFDRTCHSIRAKTRDVLGRAEKLDRPSGVLEVKWEELVAQMDRKSHRLAQRPMRPQRLSSDPSLASARQRQSPVSGLRSGSGSGSLGLTTMASESTTSLDAAFVSGGGGGSGGASGSGGGDSGYITTSGARESLLTSPPPIPPGSAPAHRTRAPAPPYPQARLATDQSETNTSSPGEPSPPGSGSLWSSSGAEDERFPAHALSWDEDDGNDNQDDDERRAIVEGRMNAEKSADSRGTPRADSRGTNRLMRAKEGAVSDLSVDLPPTTTTPESKHSRRMRRFGARNLSDGSARQFALENAEDARQDEPSSALSPGLAAALTSGVMGSAVGLREGGAHSGGGGGGSAGGSGSGGGGGTARGSTTEANAPTPSSSRRNLIDGWGFRRKGASAALTPGTPTSGLGSPISKRRKESKTEIEDDARTRKGSGSEAGTVGRKGRKGKLVKDGS